MEFFDSNDLDTLYTPHGRNWPIYLNGMPLEQKPRIQVWKFLSSEYFLPKVADLEALSHLAIDKLYLFKNRLNIILDFHVGNSGRSSLCPINYKTWAHLWWVIQVSSGRHLPLYPEFTIVERLAYHLPSTALTSSKRKTKKIKVVFGTFSALDIKWIMKKKYAEELLNNDVFFSIERKLSINYYAKQNFFTGHLLRQVTSSNRPY